MVNHHHYYKVKIPLLADIERSDSSPKLIGNGSNISFSQPDIEGKSLLKRIEAFLSKELAATNETRNDQDIQMPNNVDGQSLLLSSNTKLNIYKQAFSVSKFHMTFSCYDENE